MKNEHGDTMLYMAGGTADDNNHDKIDGKTKGKANDKALFSASAESKPEGQLVAGLAQAYVKDDAPPSTHGTDRGTSALRADLKTKDLEREVHAAGRLGKVIRKIFKKKRAQKQLEITRGYLAGGVSGQNAAAQATLERYRQAGMIMPYRDNPRVQAKYGNQIFHHYPQVVGS
jgi:hypothetical protein